MNKYQKNIQLQLYNSFKTKAVAKIFFEPQNIEELKKCIEDFQSEPKLVIGSGCNLFFTKNFEGLVIKPNLYGIQVTDDTDFVYIEAMASENWDQFVQYCVDRKYTGVENLSLIPGTVGASPIQNIGAYGAEVKDVIEKVKAIDVETNKIVEFTNTECKFAYRDSFFKQNNHYVITSVVFKLNKSFTYIPKYADLNKSLEHVQNPTLQDVRDAVIQVRRNKLPDEKLLPNAGSFFKNPYLTKEQATILQKQYADLPLYPINDEYVKTSAAFLIDRAGFKGKQIGNIGTYPKQALIIVNYGATDGNEIVSFMKIIQQNVLDAFGVELEPEVWIL